VARESCLYGVGAHHTISSSGEIFLSGTEYVVK